MDKKGDKKNKSQNYKKKTSTSKISKEKEQEMKKLLLILVLISTGCIVTKVQSITVENSTDVKIDGKVKGSDPADSFSGNKGSLEIPLVP